MRPPMGIVLTGPDPLTQGRAASHSLPVSVSDPPAITFDKTLIAEAGARVPFDLLPSAWMLLERWDLAVPIWKYGVTALDVGTPEERALTSQVVADLRVPLHAYELLFVRDSRVGRQFVETWWQEDFPSGNRRLAFLRALHKVKPMACYLPQTWLLDVRDPVSPLPRQRGQPLPSSRPLVRLEIAPGRFVKVHAGDEQKAIEQYKAQQRGGRR